MGNDADRGMLVSKQHFFLVGAWPPDSEYAVRHVNPHHAAIPDVPSQDPIERSQHLIDWSPDHRTSEQNWESTHQHLQVRQHRSAKRHLSAESPDSTAFDPRGLE